jgi:predicted RNA-binding protein with PIN domain
MGREVQLYGYNVIRRDPTLARLERTSLELARDTLLSILNSSPQFRHDEVTVVFDGAGSLEAGVRGSRTFKRGRVRVMFSPPGESADAVLAHLAQDAPRGTLVVTV